MKIIIPSIVLIITVLVTAKLRTSHSRALEIISYCLLPVPFYYLGSSIKALRPFAATGIFTFVLAYTVIYVFTTAFLVAASIHLFKKRS